MVSVIVRDSRATVYKIVWGWATIHRSIANWLLHFRYFSRGQMPRKWDLFELNRVQMRLKVHHFI